MLREGRDLVASTLAVSGVESPRSLEA
jgi:hypothetical protein